MSTTNADLPVVGWLGVAEKGAVKGREKLLPNQPVRFSLI